MNKISKVVSIILFIFGIPVCLFGFVGMFAVLPFGLIILGCGVVMILPFILPKIRAKRAARKSGNKAAANTNSIQSASSAPALQYKHNDFHSWIYEDFFDRDTHTNWISKYTYDNVDIYRPDSSFSEIFPYDIVNIVPEPDNPHDNHAIAVKFNDVTIGYLYRNKLQDMVWDFMGRGDCVYAQVQTVAGPNVSIKLFFCVKRDTLPQKEPFVVRLTANSSAEMQDDIENLCSTYDSVDFDYDYDKEKYLVYLSDCGANIGYVPKSQSVMMQELEKDHYEFSGYITDISENENGKYIVRVEIQPE